MLTTIASGRTCRKLNGVVLDFADVYGLNAIDGSGDPMDDNAHGTHCAGTIGGVGNNGRGVVGVAHKVSIMACKFLDRRGSGYTSDAISCLDYALNMGAAITSNSWGGGGSSTAMSNLIDVAERTGQLFVAAAGNSAGNNDRNPNFPANYPQDIVISVASTTESDSKSYFSCYGSTTVDLGAPGSNIYSTVPGNGYSSFSGTSMATPHVAGALALMYSVNPDLTAADAKRIVMSSGTSISALSGITVSGKRLDVAAALAAVGEPTNPSPSPSAPTPAPTPFPTASPSAPTPAPTPLASTPSPTATTPAPTSAPTPSPSPSPSPLPSPTPPPEVCPPDNCKDDPDYLFKGKRNRNCNWVAKRANRCNRADNVRGCPVTCGACKPSELR